MSGAVFTSEFSYTDWKRLTNSHVSYHQDLICHTINLLNRQLVHTLTSTMMVHRKDSILMRTSVTMRKDLREDQTGKGSR